MIRRKFARLKQRATRVALLMDSKSSRQIRADARFGKLAQHFATGAVATDRPAGVATPNWIAINDKLGFVVVPPATYPVAMPDKQTLLLTPAASGYFMARSGVGWQRLVIVKPMKGPGASG
jgi:hypothetical protein